MQKFLLFDYNLLLDDEGEDFLDSLIIKLVNPKDPQDTFDQQFSQLQKQDNFQMAIVSILNLINSQAVKFINVLLVAPSTVFFTSILQEQFKKRELEMPYALQNYLDLQKQFKKIEKVRLTSLSEMAEHFKEFQLWSNISKMKVVIIKLRTQQNVSKNKINSSEQYSNEESKREQNYKEEYAEPIRFKQSKQRPLWCRQDLYKNSIPINSESEDYCRQFYPPLPPKKRLFSKNYQLHQQSLPSLKQNFDQSFRLNKKTSFNQLTSNSYLQKEKDWLAFKSVRIRGLPFEMNQQNVFELFMPYLPLGNSVKMGYRLGKKTGQAVILFDNENQAEQALEMHNTCVGGRFLQVMLISFQAYHNFY